MSPKKKEMPIRPHNVTAREACVVQAAADMTSCEQVRQMFIRCRRLIRQGTPSMVIDLRSVRQADTKLMACLVAVYQLARLSSVTVELVASRAVMEVMDFCRMTWLLDWTRPADANAQVSR